MKILHLAYEDPRQPGSGGGSVRTREITRRLSGRHQITLVTAAYPGARRRREDGARWEPTGPRTGTLLDRLAYFALAGLAARRVRHDLLVDDFGAPFSVTGAPLFTARPVVASVQWLFADEMRAKYRLPFDVVEREGIRLYDRFLAVSEWVAERVRARRPGARIWTVPNGVPPELFSVDTRAPRHLLYLGRLDSRQKGCDLLLEAYARIGRTLGCRTPPLVVAGDGPDRAALERQATRLGVTDGVRFVGRVAGVQKLDLLAAAHAVLMPSRFETFGMVAVEAQAAGVPVVAFEVGPLTHVTGRAGARLVQPFDVEAFADAACAVTREPTVRAALAAEGRAWARRYDWDVIARQQEACYLEAVAAS